MDWSAFVLSLQLSACTVAILFVIGLIFSRFLAWREFPGKSLVEAVVALPLVLPPTVLGYYLLVFFGRASPMGMIIESITGHSLVFSFQGLVFASVIYSLPFAVQPMLRAFEAVPYNLREAAWCSGLGRWRTFWEIELPLARNGILSGIALSFAHTLGEFGIVLMVGGNIAGETRTISIAIFDSVQSFEETAAGVMSLALLIFSFVTVSLVYLLNRRGSRWLALGR